jgi:hypothetical protein
MPYYFHLKTILMKSYFARGWNTTGCNYIKKKYVTWNIYAHIQYIYLWQEIVYKIDELKPQLH